ncbi:nitroreductase family protein [Desulforhabdus amnigena]|jgi:nitroreductase|uniref:Nitroreductase domain-containing protein n=1 Tax=Desulforhabdus amnigena TaxID=40218 RepID=A0A9W6FSE4_9BACT|nr:nitroreductase family protein [Desulforhabdus amnigena]NLJ29920.1 nitroreductase family protein [Deltaproteobacteria bacterium]GLI33963.1 hypothetical protein DAMNIGENAA_13960 [Desulforhabdus amnigena]
MNAKTTPSEDMRTSTHLEYLICSRYSERFFTGEPLPAGSVQRIVETALHAPSPSGRNPFYFVIAEERKALEELAQELRSSFLELHVKSCGDASRNKVISYYERYSIFLENAAALLLCYTNDRKSALDALFSDAKSEAANLISLGTVLQNIGLLCTESNIGHCILSAPVELFPELFDHIFRAPPHLTLRCLVALGRAAGKGRKKPKAIPAQRYVKVLQR